ncbi:MAG TPA: DUF86 domain-containing protein [Methanocorpusculum sp.]|nr:DUF86 domain-containing protein [Methanocorpusculum sp.]HJK79800.1 DUF86 domain-containing protein [Methanocorpusculum sp.]
MKEGSDRVYLLHIRDEITFLEENTHDLSYERLDSDKVIQHVVQKSLEIIGEASKKLSTETKDRCTQIPWHHVAGMRDRLTHGYFEVNWELVWNVLQNDIMPLKACINRILTEKGWN